jgi:hypothetical protein
VGFLAATGLSWWASGESVSVSNSAPFGSAQARRTTLRLSPFGISGSF